MTNSVVLDEYGFRRHPIDRHGMLSVKGAPKKGSSPTCFPNALAAICRGRMSKSFHMTRVHATAFERVCAWHLRFQSKGLLRWDEMRMKVVVYLR